LTKENERWLGVSEILCNLYALFVIVQQREDSHFFAAYGRYFDTNIWRATLVLRSEAWNLGINSVGALGIRTMKLTLIEFAAR